MFLNAFRVEQNYSAGDICLVSFELYIAAEQKIEVDL